MVISITPAEVSPPTGEVRNDTLRGRLVTLPEGAGSRERGAGSSGGLSGWGKPLTRRAGRAYARRESAPSRTLSPTPDRRRYRRFGPPNRGRARACHGQAVQAVL